MDPPPAAPPSSSATAVVPPPHHVSSCADSVESSPRSRNTDSWDEPLPPSAMRLRLMCSYGGHIVPRPHDKSLCYVGGDTRIVVVDRNSSLSDLHARLSKTLLNGRVFTLKYQLPSEDLDSLISVTTDEDLDNMIDEYDRTAHSSSNKPSRIRLFLFPSKPDLSQSIGPILDNPAKSEDWFLNALNGAAGMLNRGFSDSATVNCLLGLDDEGILGGGNLNNSNNMNNLDLGSRDDVSQPGSFTNFKKGGHDVHSVPDSPMLDTTSSFGSTSSSPSLANLPPIRVHVEDGGSGVRVQDQRVVGIEEQFAQMGIAQSGQKQEESGFVLLSSPPPMPNTIVASAVPVSTVSAPVDYTNRVVSDDERSDQGLPIGYRKKPQPQVQVQVQAQNLPTQSQPKSTGFVDLPSPDSVSSDSSIANAISRSKPVIYQDQVAQIPSGTSRVPSANPVDPKLNISDQNARVQMQQFQDSGYILQQQLDSRQHQQHHQQLQAQQQQHQQLQAQQQQHQQQAQQQQHQQQAQQQQHQQQAQQQQHQQQAQQQQHQQQAQQQQHQQQAQQQQHQQLQAQQQQQQLQAQQQQQYIHAGAHYFQQHPAGNVPISAYYPVYPSQQQQHHPHHPQLDQQYPVYYVPARQAQAYNNLSVQQQSNVSEATNSSRPQTHANPTMVAPSAAYNPMRNTPLTKPENAAGMYRTATTAAPQLVQVPSSQHQQQYVGYSQIHHPSQSIAPTSAAPANYAYEYADASHGQIYYTQPLAPTMPSHSQYQTMTATGAVMMPEVSGQVPQDNMKQQQMRSS